MFDARVGQFAALARHHRAAARAHCELSASLDVEDRTAGCRSVPSL